MHNFISLLFYPFFFFFQYNIRLLKILDFGRHVLCNSNPPLLKRIKSPKTNKIEYTCEAYSKCDEVIEETEVLHRGLCAV